MEVPKDIEYIPNEDEESWSSSFLNFSFLWLNCLIIDLSYIKNWNNHSINHSSLRNTVSFAANSSRMLAFCWTNQTRWKAFCYFCCLCSFRKFPLGPFWSWMPFHCFCILGFSPTPNSVFSHFISGWSQSYFETKFQLHLFHLNSDLNFLWPAFISFWFVSKMKLDSSCIQAL